MSRRSFLPPRQLRQRSSLLKLLLRPCGDTNSARNELRWLRERALAIWKSNKPSPQHYRPWQATWRRLCYERSTGKPLQYVLGDQPFGDLEILCRPGVLIPRPETESITHALAKRLSRPKTKRKPLRILDLCSGTGCISLLLHSLLAPSVPGLKIRGLDLSPTATALARENLQHNLEQGKILLRGLKDVVFETADIFDAATTSTLAGDWDVVVSNPPYISPVSFKTTTSPSVRLFEPLMALVPPTTSSTQSDEVVADSFYPQLLSQAAQVDAHTILFEVADMAQAKRVARLVVAAQRWRVCEIWRDWPDQATDNGEEVDVFDRKIPVCGSGNGRAVYASGRVL